jgi:hypothetical protein
VDANFYITFTSGLNKFHALQEFSTNSDFGLLGISTHEEFLLSVVFLIPIRMFLSPQKSFQKSNEKNPI